MRRMNFILDQSLVLYLPLYELDGASFASRDAYGHLCTVSGATWGIQGRTFDGIDDKIVIPDNPVFSFGNGLTDVAFSLLAWIKLTDASVNRFILTKETTGLQEWSWQVLSDNTFRFCAIDNSALVQATRTYTFSLFGQWVFLGGSYNGVGGATAANGITLYENGAVKTSTANNNASYVAMEDLTASVQIGARGQADTWFKGSIGEVFVFNRSLSPLEFQNIYLATKWRYQ